METGLLKGRSLSSSRLKPTYEGWKPHNVLFPATWQPGLKPTYEGWKHPLIKVSMEASTCLKPTYEGWKHVG